MDFQKLLLEVGKALTGEEVTALAFLCTDLLGQNTSSMDSASDLFSLLMDRDLLSAEQPQLLAELLRIIQRTRLLRDLGLDDQDGTTPNFVPAYRKMLYSLSEDITVKDLKAMKFILTKNLPRRKLEENVSTLAVFLEMERMDLISETNLDMLENILKSVCPVLSEQIHQFKALPVQESSRQRSFSLPNPNQASASVFPTAPLGLQEYSLSNLNSSNTSIDVSRSEERSEESSRALPQELSSLDINQARLKRMPSQESQAFPETQTNEGGLDTYPMTGARRGICVIMNNYDFSKSRPMKNREGTMNDQKSLEIVFSWLGFDVEVHNDCNRTEMLSVISDLSKRSHSQMDCLVCCVLSHGLEGGVYGVDGHFVNLTNLTDPFDGLKCPSLIEKPKLFFIQACQGRSEQKPVETDGHEFNHVACDAGKVKASIPSGADFLLGMATVPSCVSYREYHNGTWYIQSLCRNLVQMVPRGYDLVSILTKVNADVSEKTDRDGKKKQMPQPAFSLRKRVVFPIPSSPPPSLLL